MDEGMVCREAIYSEEYADYILDTGGNIEAIRRIYAPDCLQQIDASFVTIYKNRATDGEISFEKYGYGAVPKCYGLLDVQSVEATGALKLRERPGVELDGSGVLIGLVDTGIDFTNPLFQYGDGSTRIRYIWDQERDTDRSPEGIFYGTEYSREEINEALRSHSPKSMIPFSDPTYHGTFLAALAAGNDNTTENFTGMAPGVEIMMVRVKQAKQNLRDFFGIPDGAYCYQENDIMMGVRYLWQKSLILRKPLVILLGMGTNSGSHNGFSPLGVMINRLGSLSGICIVGAAGNETGFGHHYYSSVGGAEGDVIELDVEQDKSLTMEVWTEAIGVLSVELQSPDGQLTGRIPIRTYEQRIDFVFQSTTAYVFYERVEFYSGEEVITIRFKDLQNGIWRILIQNVEQEETSFHAWLPMREFVRNSRFLRSNPDTIICNPANTYQMVTVGAYDYRDGRIFVNSSRGFTENYGVKPDFVAPGVDVYGPVSPISYGVRSGTSVGAAHAAGAAAMLLQWGIVRENNLGMNTITVKNYLIRGADRSRLDVPDRSYGWGILNIYNTFEGLKNI